MKITHVFVRCQNRSHSVSVPQQELLNEIHDCEKKFHRIWIKPNLSSKQFIFEIKNIIKITLCMKLCSVVHLIYVFQVEHETGSVLMLFFHKKCRIYFTRNVGWATTIDFGSILVLYNRLQIICNYYVLETLKSLTPINYIYIVTC